MAFDENLSLHQQLAATLDWWREAGVDCVFTDQPQPLLAAPDAAPAQKAVRRAAVPVVEATLGPPLFPAPSDCPQELAAFAAFWADPRTALPGIPERRIGPRISAGASLLVLVATPEAEDETRLLQGREGQLIDGLLRALGIAPDTAAIISALPAYQPLPDWAALAEQGLAPLVLHHITLARPERVLLLGSPLLTLFGLDPREAQGPFVLSTPSGDIPALATYSPDRLLGHSRERARLWQRLLDWMPE